MDTNNDKYVRTRNEVLMKDSKSDWIDLMVLVVRFKSLAGS